MKKFLSIFLTLVIVVGIGAVVVLPGSAASAYRGHHRGGGHHRSTSTRGTYAQYGERPRQERHLEEYEKYLDGLVDEGKLTKEEAAEYKADPARLRAYCYEHYPEDYGTGYRGGNAGRGRGLHCRW